MPHSSSFHFRKTTNLSRNYYEGKVTTRHRFRDVSHMKLTDIFKSLRRRRLRRDTVSHRSLTHPRSLPLPFADHDSSPAQPPSPDPCTSPSLRVSYYRSDASAESTLSATAEDGSFGMSTSSSGLEGTPGPPDVLESRRQPVPAFPTSPSVFQLRSTSTKDYLVERLEQHLRRLSLGDASPDHPALPKSSSRDIAMDVCLGSPNVSLQHTVDPDVRSDKRDAQKPASLPHDQNVVPMILITSVDAKHAKPLPPSAQRPSRTPFGPSNHIDHLTTNVPSATKFERKTTPDDPFTTQPYGFVYPPDYNLTFRLPPFPSVYSSPSKDAPETPTPMCCDHFGDCRGDLWEILHPPLVAGTFTLPPFKLPPLSLSAGLFDDVSTTLPC